MQGSSVLRQKIKDSLARVQEEQTILFFMLSDWVYVLLIPESYRYSDHETKQIAGEIQKNILPDKHPEHLFRILTWQEVIHQNQHLSQAFAGWKSTREIRTIFFVDETTLEVASESLWLAEELEITLKKRQKQQEKNRKLCSNLLSQLPAGINLKVAWQSLEFSGQILGDWLKPLRAEDWSHLGRPVQISLKSSDFLKTWPQALGERGNDFFWAVEVELGQSLRPVLLDETQQAQTLLNHYQREAKRCVGLRQFEAQVYVHEDLELFAVLLVGEQIASIAAFPELVRGAIQTFYPKLQTVRVISSCEDMILVVDPTSSDLIIHELSEKAKVLLEDRTEDGVDALSYDHLVLLSDYPCGRFTLHEIPGPYFDLIYAAKEARLALPPGRAEYLKGLAYELIQAWSKAVEAFRVAFRYNIADGDINHALGRALIEVGRHEEAIAFLNRAGKILPEDPDVANGLGIAYLECGQKDAAIHQLEKAVALSPEDAQFLSNLGRGYFTSKRWNEAESVLLRALEVSPNLSEAHATLAQVKWRMGDLTVARKHARKAFAANPGSQYMQDLLWALTVDEVKA